MKKNQNAAKLIALTAIIVVTALIFALGLPLSKVAGVYDILPISRLYKYGIDFKGGSYATLKLSDSSADESSVQEILSESEKIFKERITSLGVYNPKAQILADNTIRIEIPSFEDGEETLATLISKSELTFQDEDGNVLISGKNVKSATYATFTDAYGLTQPAVKIDFDEEGTTLFTQATTSLKGKYLYIKLDDEVIRSPYIDETIDTGVAYISGMESKQEAIQLASVISSGSLPAEFTVEATDDIAPSLGEGALTAALYCGFGFYFALCAVMVVGFLGMGFAGVIVFSAGMIVLFLILALMGVMMTLYTLAGIVIAAGLLAFGLINTLKQMKKEAGLGKSVLASVRNGWKIGKNTYWKIFGGAAALAGTLYCFIPGVLKYTLMSAAIGCAVALLIYLLLGSFCFKAAGVITDGKGIVPKK